MACEYDAVLCDLFGTLVDDRGHAIEGAAALTGILRGARWAIVTSCGARLAAALLEHAGLPRPGVLITADDVEHQKPAPESYLQAASRLHVTPARCLVLEDSASGVRAAEAAGMDVIRVGAERPISSVVLEVHAKGIILR